MFKNHVWPKLACKSGLGGDSTNNLCSCIEDCIVCVYAYIK
jgi:hypothetical protein